MLVRVAASEQPCRGFRIPRLPTSVLSGYMILTQLRSIAEISPHKHCEEPAADDGDTLCLTKFVWKRRYGRAGRALCGVFEG